MYCKLTYISGIDPRINLNPHNKHGFVSENDLTIQKPCVFIYPYHRHVFYKENGPSTALGTQDTKIIETGTAPVLL